MSGHAGREYAWLVGKLEASGDEAIKASGYVASVRAVAACDSPSCASLCLALA